MNLRFCLPILPVLAFGALPVSAQAPPSRPHHSPLRIAAHAVGGAILGSWTGYLTAQVTWSDWNRGAGRSAQRVRYSVAGGALGFLAGALIGGTSGPPGFTGPVLPLRQPASMAAISSAEIRASNARSLTELLRKLRPQWLRSRGRDWVHLADTTATRWETAGAQPNGERVYLNGTLLGGLEALDAVPIDEITTVEFFDASAATLRWGAGHPDGAIVLSTAAGG